MAGTDGRVYGGDCNLIHVVDGQRAAMGEKIAEVIDNTMRQEYYLNGRRTEAQTFGPEAQDLCPGCYMIVGFNALVTLAQKNGQSLTELGRTMAQAFTMLAEQNELREEIHVILDAS